jgi:hypothetical protein
MRPYLLILPLLISSVSLPALAQDATPSAPPQAESAAPVTEAQPDVQPEAPAALEAAAKSGAAEPAEPETPVPPAGVGKNLIDDKMLGLIRTKIETDLVSFMVKNQNEKYADVKQEKITALDEQWVTERKQEKQPLISATLTNPLSSYLMMVQAHSYGLITAIFVMDNKGLNVGQSDITGDYWQGDEDKFQKTFQIGPDAVFIDEPEFDDDKKVWIAQANISLKDAQSGQPIGAATFDINLNELKRLRDADVSL